MLNEKMLASLRQRGVESITIANSANAADDTDGAEHTNSAAAPSRQVIEARLDFLFRRTDASAQPLRDALFALHLQERE